jgi:hypothetical protein
MSEANSTPEICSVWLPMDTAPKDGSKIIVLSDDCEWEVWWHYYPAAKEGGWIIIAHPDSVLELASPIDGWKPKTQNSELKHEA